MTTQQQYYIDKRTRRDECSVVPDRGDQLFESKYLFTKAAGLSTA